MSSSIMAFYSPQRQRPAYHDKYLKIVATGSRNGQGWAKKAENINNVIEELRDGLLESLDLNIAAARDEAYHKSVQGKLFHYDHVNQGYIYFYFYKEAEPHHHSMTELFEATGAAVYSFSLNNRGFYGIGVAETSVRVWICIWQYRLYVPLLIDELHNPPIRAGNKTIEFVTVTNQDSHHAVAKLCEVKLREFGNRTDIEFDFKNNASRPQARLFRNKITDDAVANILAGRIVSSDFYERFTKAVIAKG